MASVGSLARQLAALSAIVGKDDDPRHWCLLLEDGQEIPAIIQAQMREHDTVFVAAYPLGYLTSESEQQGQEPSIGYVQERNGHVTCLYRSGKRQAL